MVVMVMVEGDGVAGAYFLPGLGVFVQDYILLVGK